MHACRSTLEDPTENLVLNMAGGDDSFSASGNLAPLIAIRVDGGTGNDTLLGGNGNDRLDGGDGNDLIDGNGGNDTSFMGAGDDTFVWDPGDGSDIVEGQAGFDTMVFNGAPGNESFNVSANGTRVRFTRDPGGIVMDTNEVEHIAINALSGNDNITVNDLTGTGVSAIDIDLASAIGGTTADGGTDLITVNGTNDNDAILVTGTSGSASVVVNFATQINIAHTDPTLDKLTVNGLNGDDAIHAEGLAPGIIRFEAHGNDGNDDLVGTFGNDSLFGDAGDDVLVGNGGVDSLDGGPGSNVVLP